MAGVELVAGEVVGRIEAQTAVAEFAAQFLLFLLEAFGFGFGGIAPGEVIRKDLKRPETEVDCSAELMVARHSS